MKNKAPRRGRALTRYVTLIEVANHSQNGRPAGSDAPVF
jgi:hypothetical protein